MQNNNADLTNPVSAQEAQAKDSPGLSSVLEEMENGVDIQPLDDIVHGEYIEFNDNAVYESDEITETQSVKDKKKSRIKKFARSAVFVVLNVCLLVGLSAAFFHFDDFSHKANAVYQKDGQVCVKLENDKIITLDGVRNVTMSADGSKLVYSQDTASKTGKYDIRVIDFTKRSSVDKKGSVIVSGTDSDWQTDKNISYVYYTKTEQKSVKYYAYDTQSGKTDLVVSDVSEFFIPPSGDTVYYTRQTSDGKALFRKAFGEEAESLNDIQNIKSYSDDELLEIFYTVKNSDEDSDTFTLYKVSGASAPVKISDNISEVYLDDYEIGGNLYYFIKTQSDFNWQDVVDDNYADYDATLQKPEKADYLITKGFIFKRTTVDEAAYNAAMQKYSQKLLRDEIRQALSSTKFSLAIASEYKIMVYDGNISKQLAGGIKLENLLAFSKSGAPRIVFSKTGIDSKKKLTMDSLYKTASDSGVDYAVDSVVNLLSEGYEITNAVKYAWFDGNKTLEYELKTGYNASSADFIFANRGKLLAAVKSDAAHYELYCSDINSESVSKGAVFASDVISYEVHGDALLYYAESKNGTSDLYEYKDGAVNPVCENCADYYVRESGEIVAFKGIFSDSILQSVDIMLYKDAKAQSVDKNASYKYFLIKDSYFAYITNYQTAAASDSQAQKGGELKVYTGGKSKTIDSGVTDVFAVRDF